MGGKQYSPPHLVGGLDHSKGTTLLQTCFTLEGRPLSDRKTRSQSRIVFQTAHWIYLENSVRDSAVENTVSQLAWQFPTAWWLLFLGQCEGGDIQVGSEGGDIQVGSGGGDIQVGSVREGLEINSVARCRRCMVEDCAILSV